MERDRRGTRLSKSADADKVEPFCVLKDDGTFETAPSLYARLDTMSRSLTNSHQSIQRRMLFTKPEDALPSSGVIQHHVTKEVYLVGQGRSDSDGHEAYEKASVAHLVSTDSSSHTDVIKWAADDADPDSMLLTSKVIGKFYIAVEYQDSTNEEFSDREQSSRMRFYAPSTLLKEVNELCEFEYNGKMWAIRQVFGDSGFASGVVIDTGQNIETFNLVNPVNSYDPISGYWDFMTNATVKPFSASQGEGQSDLADARQYGVSNQKVLYVKAQYKFAKHFSAGKIVEDQQGKTWKIDNVKNNVRSPDVQLTLSRIYKPPVAASPEN